MFNVWSSLPWTVTALGTAMAGMFLFVSIRIARLAVRLRPWIGLLLVFHTTPRAGVPTRNELPHLHCEACRSAKRCCRDASVPEFR